MGKPKNTTINNIANASIDIDYDKLAMAIVKAKKIIEEEEQEVINNQKQERLKKFGLSTDIKGFKKIRNHVSFFFLVLFRPKKLYSEHKMIGHLMVLSTPLTAIYSIFSFICFWTGVTCTILPFRYGFSEFNWNIFFTCLGLTIFVFTLRSGFKIAIKEIENSNDIQIVATLFSSMVSFIAMIATIASVFIALKLGGVI